MKTQKEFQDYVAGFSEISPDSDEYKPLKLAIWSAEELPLEVMQQCFSQSEAVKWISVEISLAHSDGRSHGETYSYMLDHGSSDPVVVTLDKDNVITVIDGWHRIAIGVVRNQPVKAVIGRWN